MQSKRGLSDIVTNVLIILLVLVAVGIIWAFVNPLLTKSGKSTQGVEDCLNIKVEPVSCDANTGQIIIKRNAGAGDLKRLSMVFATGTVTRPFVFPTPGNLALNELSSISITSSMGFSGGDTLRVAAIVGAGSSEKTCDLSQKIVTCTGGTFSPGS